MKSKLFLMIIFWLISSSMGSYSQNGCKVLKPEISGKYRGECKKGLANGKGVAEGIDKYQGRFKNGFPHGKGIYTWANGDTHNGFFAKGVRQGEGTFTINRNGIDSIISGIWENDHLIRKITPPPYKVFIARDFDKYSITKIKDGNKISLKLKQMGMQNIDLSYFSFHADNGSYHNVGNTYVYSQVNFPVQVKISYTTKNKLKTKEIFPMLEVMINEPGEWEIVLTN